MNNGDPTKYVPFVLEFEKWLKNGYENLVDIAAGLAANSTGIDYSALKTCSEGAQGNEWEAQEARNTPDHKVCSVDFCLPACWHILVQFC